MTFEDDYSAYWVYFVNFLGTLAVLPGNIVSALLMDKIGRLSMLGMTKHDLGFFFFGSGTITAVCKMSCGVGLCTVPAVTPSDVNEAVSEV